MKRLMIILCLLFSIANLFAANPSEKRSIPCRIRIDNADFQPRIVYFVNPTSSDCHPSYVVIGSRHSETQKFYCSPVTIARDNKLGLRSNCSAQLRRIVGMNADVTAFQPLDQFRLLGKNQCAYLQISGNSFVTKKIVPCG